MSQTAKEIQNDDDKDIQNYEKLAQRAKQVIQSGFESSEQWVEQALDRASEQLEVAGEYTREEGERAKAFLRRDLEATKEDFAQAAEATRRALHPSRLGGGFLGLSAHMFEALGDAFRSWARRSHEALRYNTGEISGPGTLTCFACGTQLHLDKTTRLPPCPKCHATEYAKSY